MNKALSGGTEDYMGALYEIMQRKEYVRIRGIAMELGVRPPSAVEMMKKLDRWSVGATLILIFAFGCLEGLCGMSWAGNASLP